MAWWMLPAAAITAAGAFASGERTNKINQREAQKNRDFQAAQAATNRQFQERMRNTAWQASVEDMRAAGINPAVAYSQGPAASPGGSTAGGATAAPATDSVGSALQAAQAAKQLELLEQQARKTRAEAELQEHTTDAWTRATTRPGKGMSVEHSGPSPMEQRITAEVGNLFAQGQLSLANTNFLRQRTRLAPFQSIGTALGSAFDWMRNEGGQSMNRLFRPGGSR